MANTPISGLVKKAAPPYSPSFVDPDTGAMIEILDTTNVSMAATGTNSRIAPGDLLAGFLVAGANVTITPSLGQVVIAATGGGGGGGTPGGSTGQIQTNNGAGGFGALPVPLGVDSGGTGLASLMSHAVMLGHGALAPGFASVGIAGRLLLDQGAGNDPTFRIASGDVTVTAAGVMTIAAGAVTPAKQANFDPAALMGNPTLSPAAPSAITLGANLSFSGTTLVTTAGTPGGSSGDIQTNNGSGGFGSLPVPLGVASGGTGSTYLTPRSVMLGAGLSTPTFASTGVAGRVLLDQGSVTDPSFQAISGDVAITSSGVTTIQPGSVTLAKQAAFQAASLMGNPTGIAAMPSPITLGAGLSFSGATLIATSAGGMTNPMTTTGDTIYASASGSPAAPGGWESDLQAKSSPWSRDCQDGPRSPKVRLRTW